MPQYLDDNGNPIKAPVSGGKAPVYLDDKGEPIAASPVKSPVPTMQAAPAPTMGQRVSKFINEPLGMGEFQHSPKEMAKEVGEGVGVGTAGALLGAEAPAMGTGALGSAGLYAANEALHGHLPTLKGAGEAAATGAVLGPVFKYGGSAFEKTLPSGGALERILGILRGGKSEVLEGAEQVPTMTDTEPTMSEGRPATWSNEHVSELAKSGDRDAITQATKRGLKLPENAKYVGNAPSKGPIQLTDNPDYAAPKMKTTFREPRYAYRGTNPGEEEISGAKYDQLSTSPEEAASYARQKGGKLIRVDLNKLPEDSFDVSGGIGMPNLIRTLKPVPKHLLEEIPLK